MSADDHGSRSTYNNHGCRCDECRAAHAAYVARRSAERRAELAAGAATLPHGVLSTYNAWGCRCEDCRAAHAARERRYSHQRKAAAS